jgi:hypothetical protein
MDRQTFNFFRLATAAGILAAAAHVLFAAPASAQEDQNCAPRDQVVERLATKYGESRETIGLAGGGTSIVEQFANRETGSWTITITTAEMITCLVASGQSFEGLAEDLPPAGDLG